MQGSSKKALAGLRISSVAVSMHSHIHLMTYLFIKPEGMRDIRVCFDSDDASLTCRAISGGVQLRGFWSGWQ